MRESEGENGATSKAAAVREGDGLSFSEGLRGGGDSVEEPLPRDL